MKLSITRRHNFSDFIRGKIVKPRVVFNEISSSLENPATFSNLALKLFDLDVVTLVDFLFYLCMKQLLVKLVHSPIVQN